MTRKVGEPEQDVAAHERLLTVAEVASFCRVSQVTVRRAEREGQLRGVRLTPHVLRFRQADVDAWIEASA
jgi:excisionase family DNA binding protein